MKHKNKEIRNKVNPAVTGASGGVSLDREETSTPNLHDVRNAGVNGEVEQNVLSKGLEDESEVLGNLLKRLESIDQPNAAKRLLSLYNIMEQEDFDPENSDLLNLASAKDFVTFLETVQLDGGPHFGMSDLGQISSDWHDNYGLYLTMDFLGNKQVSGAVKINSQFHPIKLNLNEIKSKLSELKVI